MQRPTAVTVLAVLNIGFAVIGVFGMMATLTMLRGGSDSSNPVLRTMTENPTYMAWLRMSVPISSVCLVALLISGIGLLRLQNWARLLAIVYAIVAIIIGIIGIFVNVTCLVMPMLQRANQSGPELAAAIGGAIGGTIGGVVGMIYPVVLIVFLVRKNIVAAFRPVQPPPTPTVPL